MARRLAAILAADVVGYSKLMAEDEAGTLSALKAHRAELFDPKTQKHGGRIVKLMGDGVLVEFPSVVDAVECALAIQTALATGDGKIKLRIGINLGDVIIDGDDIYGDGVNVAARLEALAEPGGIAVSGKVYEEVSGKVSVSAEDAGEVQLKNIAKPVKVWKVGFAQPAPTVQTTHQERGPALSIAVLAFDNMSGIPEQDYICEGISENIIINLSRFRDITVIARNSSFAYRGKSTRVQDIRRELGVDYILEGSVQRAGDRMRVNAQLVEGASGKHLWVERYDRRADDLFAVMDEITELIVGTLATTYGGRLRKAAGAQRAAAGPRSFGAFDHFLHGMEELNRFTKDSISRAIAHFEQAIEVDPRYAKAHGKLAWSHLMNVEFGWSADDEDSRQRARKAADAAVRADDDEAWAHWAIAGCAQADHQHEKALAAMSRAVDLNPNDADVLTDMGIFCALAGKAKEGLNFALKAMRINPHHPEYYADQLGHIYFLARQYEDSIRTIESIHSLKTPSMLVFLTASHAALGHGEETRSAVADLLASEPQSTVAYWTRPEFVPYRDEGDRVHLATMLERAGLPVS